MGSNAPDLASFAGTNQATCRQPPLSNDLALAAPGQAGLETFRKEYWLEPKTGYILGVDPITQGALGAAVVVASFGQRTPFTLATCALFGAAGGMTADLDVLIRSSSDPFLAIEYQWFARRWVAVSPEDPQVLGDLRYSFTPTEALPIWGTRLSEDGQHANWVNNRAKRGISWQHLKSLWFEEGPDARCRRR